MQKSIKVKEGKNEFFVWIQEVRNKEIEETSSSFFDLSENESISLPVNNVEDVNVNNEDIQPRDPDQENNLNEEENRQEDNCRMEDPFQHEGNAATDNSAINNVEIGDLMLGLENRPFHENRSLEVLPNSDQNEDTLNIEGQECNAEKDN